MLVVEMIAKIGRAFFAQGLACRTKSFGRGATEFHHEREHQPLPRIGLRERLDAMLLANAAKPAQGQCPRVLLFWPMKSADMIAMSIFP
jgi:hypothetical protein